jgi:hypothetical protein
VAAAGRASQQEAQAALVESGRAGVANIEASVPRSETYLRTFGGQARPVANPAANAEAALMNEQIAALAGVPERHLPAEIESGAAYLFRTDPGHRMSPIRLPGVPQCRNEAHQKYHERRYEAKYSEEERAYHELLTELAGGLYLTPTVVARKQECYWEFDESQLPLVEFMREQIAVGKLPHVYEDVPKHQLEASLQPTHRQQAALRLRLSQGNDRVFTEPKSGKAALKQIDKIIAASAPKPKRQRAKPSGPPPPRDPKTGRLLPRTAPPAPTGD